MTNNYIKFHEDIAIADTAFTVRGKTEEELFENAGSALFSSMADVSTIEQIQKRSISLDAEKLDLLLFDFLNELILIKDTENLIFSRFDISIQRNDSNYHINATVYGEVVNPQKHKITIDIKAITMHMFRLEKKKDYYEARVVIDI